MKYVDLIIENKSNSTDQMYTYGCNDDSIRIGAKVKVHFARGRNLRDAYVFDVSDVTEHKFRDLKYVEEIDSEVSLTEEMVETCKWMKKRYLVRYIDAVSQFTPAGSPSKRGKKRKPLLGVNGERQDISRLTDEQSDALDNIYDSLCSKRHELILLHGVTGSGKTEVYMRTIGRCIDEGRTAIMLVPEISLTKQIIERFIERFGENNLAVLHSRLSAGERYDEWMRIRTGQAKIVIGARSAVFAPLTDIGAIIMDEEHEETYKSDMTPKYETLEVAVKRAKTFGGIVLMGSATPSVVSYQRCRDGIYKLLTMKERYNKVSLPDIEVVDMRTELKQGNKSVLSRRLFSEMGAQLEAGKQVILFLNRRGYSNFVSCRECGYVIRCADCGISMTYHKDSNRMICHYCGKSCQVPKKCPNCGSKYIRHFGAGTEKVEEVIAEMFKEYSVGRLDMDTMKRKGALDRILDDFGTGKTDILTGTQIVAKGLDFRNVGLVGIISADVTLNIPDYRAPEHTFQLITQAAGRAGRGNEKGKVIIQTYTPDNYAILSASSQDYDHFFEKEISIRRFMGYPPFSDLIQLVFSGNDNEELKIYVEEWETELTGALREEGENIFPPRNIPPMPGSGTFRISMLLKCPKGERGKFLGAIEKIRKDKSKNKKCNSAVDINPYSLWRN